MPDPDPSDPLPVCRRWFGHDAVVVEPLPSAGLSGAATWAVGHAGRAFVLKSFVGSASRPHAEWVHGLMQHVRAAGVPQVPEVCVGHGGGTVQAGLDGTLWELAARMPGAATNRPSPRQAAAAGELLARVHLAAATLPGDWPRDGIPSSVQRRIAGARDLLARPWSMRDPLAAPPGIAERWARAATLMATDAGGRALAAVATAPSFPCPLQPVLRDVWSDHVLFEGARVTGLVDWHAANIDTPSTDIARLLGSWPDDRVITGAFFEAYASLRRLDRRSLAMIPFLQAMGVILGLDNWFRWTMEEGRRFADISMVHARIDRLLGALPSAIDCLVAGAALRWQTST